MNQERPTPETDANSERDFDGIDSCDATFARKLERERDEARELMRKVSGSLELALEFFNHWDGVPMWAGLQDAQHAIAKVKEVIQ